MKMLLGAALICTTSAANTGGSRVDASSWSRAVFAAALVAPTAQARVAPTKAPTYAVQVTKWTKDKPVFADTVTAAPSFSGSATGVLHPPIYIVPKDPTEPAVDPTAKPILPICNPCIGYQFWLDEDMGTYCQDRQDKCWSNVDCTGDGRLCQVGVDWSLPANQCLRPIDVQILLDESASITDANWAEAKEFIRRYAIALNGGKDGARLGLRNDQVRISVIHWSDSGQQTMGIPFRQTGSLAVFSAHLAGLTRQYIGLGCPGSALKWTVHYSLCSTTSTSPCQNSMPMSALVHATQGPQKPPTIVNPETGVEGVAPDTGAIAGTKTTALKRRRAELTKAAQSLQKPVLTAAQCCVTCYEGKACGNQCIAKDAACLVKILGGCACDVVSPTTDPAFLYKAGTYVLSKQGLAAVRTPPTTGGTTGSGGQYTSCGCIPIADPTNCILFMTDLSLVTAKSQTCKSVCEMRTDTNKECGYTYAEYSAELGFRSNSAGGATVVVMATDGNPAPAAECNGEASRTNAIANVKSKTDRMVPIGIGPYVDVGTLLTLSKGMPASMPYVTTSFGSLTSALDVLATLTCPTQAPTLPPTLAPTRAPTTAKPTRKPTHAGGCANAERAACGWPGNVQSMCMCADALCTRKQCGCNKGFACSTGACTTCTAAPTRVPTDSPTRVPTDSPTLNPTYSPSLAPTKFPTKVPTFVPTRTPTFSVTCTTAQLATCDSTNGICSVDTSGGVHCACGDGYGCTDAGCGTCTAAPTLVPTDSPTRLPTGSPSLQPTNEPSLAPTGFPTETPTSEPSMMPTFAFVCSAAEKAGCDSAVGTCYCADAGCTAKKCGCAENWGCTDVGCGTCTAAPTLAPTENPTSAPTTSPTAGPTNYALFAIGEVSAQDNKGLDSLTQEQQIGAAAALSGLALLLLILGIIAVVVIVVLVAATATGVLVYRKRMFDISSHAFEGEIVAESSVPVGAEVAPPPWARECGGNGINPMGNRNAQQLQRPPSLANFLKKTFSTHQLKKTFSMRQVVQARPAGQMEMVSLPESDGNQFASDVAVPVEHEYGI